MTVVKGYKTTASDMWGGGDASNLDKVASNAVLWGTGKMMELGQLSQKKMTQGWVVNGESPR